MDDDDGRWTTRDGIGSHVSQLGGVVVVIGFYIKKLLDIQVRSKLCSICDSVKEGASIKEHVCFKNWTQSSQAMEADGALVAFEAWTEISASCS